VSNVLKTALGVTFPAPNTWAQNGDARIVCSGREQAFLIGAACPDLVGLAAVTDQSGGWATLSISGPAAVDTLARYVPLDLRRMAVGGAARSQLYHMPLCLMRLGADRFHVMTFRSMARTAWHELDMAMKTLAARQI
jgi:sarcosine oxidase subunit gamma